MASATISRWARRFLIVGLGFLVLAHLAAIAALPARTTLVAGLQGFVCVVAFGKAYSLVPSYFDRTLAWPIAPALHLPLAAGGSLALALAPVAGLPTVALRETGAVLWAAGVGLFVATLAVTIRDNPLGGETATSDANEQRRRTDRLANAFMPVALAYLLAGSYELLAGAVGLPTLLGGGYVRVAHLLAAGFATVLVLSVGVRLLPRFLVVDSPTHLPWIVLPAGALGPVLIAAGLYSGPVFVLGAALEAVAIGGFAVTYLAMFWRSERRRVGLWGPVAGVVAGAVGVALGLQFAFDAVQAALATVHRRLNVFGFLGLTIVGLLYQFYPPAVGVWPGASDRTALATIATMAVGVGLAAIGPLVGGPTAAVGHGLVAVAAAGVAYLLGATMAHRGGP